MQKTRCAILVSFLAASIFLTAPVSCPAAGISLSKNVASFFSRHADDVAKLGRNAKTVLTQSDKLRIIKKYPSLASKGDDLVRGAIMIERVAQKSPAAAKMMERGINPAKVARLAERSPEAIQKAENIASTFGAGSIKLSDSALKKLPVQAREAFRKINGNYALAAESYLDMARKGGPKAIDVAEKLSKYLTLKDAAAVTAAGLLAWHMRDPEACEEAITKFFKHVGAVVTVPAIGMTDAAMDSGEKVFENLESRLSDFAARHLKWIVPGGLFVLLLCSASFRRFPVTVIDYFFKKINYKLEGGMPKASSSRQEMRDAQTGQSDAPSLRPRINVYKKN